MSRIFYEDGVREPEQPPEHHEPPLGFEVCQECGDALEDKDVLTIYNGILPSEVDENTIHEYICTDCHYPFDGDGLVLCDAHKEEE